MNIMAPRPVSLLTFYLFYVFFELLYFHGQPIKTLHSVTSYKKINIFVLTTNQM